MQAKNTQDINVAEKVNEDNLDDIQAKISDSEFEKMHNIQLRRPPLTSDEALKTL